MDRYMHQYTYIRMYTCLHTHTHCTHMYKRSSENFVQDVEKNSGRLKGLAGLEGVHLEVHG